MSTRRNKVMICTYLEPEQVKALNDASRWDGRTKAEIIREAIAAWLRRRKPTQIERKTP